MNARAHNCLQSKSFATVYDKIQKSEQINRNQIAKEKKINNMNKKKHLKKIERRFQFLMPDVHTPYIKIEDNRDARKNEIKNHEIFNFWMNVICFHLIWTRTHSLVTSTPKFWFSNWPFSK